MPPRVKITKEDIVNAAVELVRQSGAQSINARAIVSALDCSTQPLFSNFSSMEELKIAVVQRADELCQEYIQKEIARGEFPPYKASGMAYIRFAMEEKELFKLLYMRDRLGESDEQLGFSGDMLNIVKSSTGLDGDDMVFFHLEMWAYVHGIATMFATGFLDLDWELVSRMLTDSYLGLKKQYEKE